MLLLSILVVGWALVPPSTPVRRGGRVFSTELEVVEEEVAMGPPPDDPNDVPAVVVGGGRIGGLLSSLGPKDVMMTRTSGWPEDAPAEGPIYVCTRNDALDSVIDATPVDRRDDLVFLQNGMLGPYLESKGLAHATQGLVYFAVAKLGDAPVDGVTDLDPQGLTTATGKWAPAFKARLAKAGLKCHVKEGEDFQRAMLEKHVWICAFMLVGASRGCTVGEVEANYASEFDELAEEMVSAGEAALGITLAPGYLDRLKAYARSVSHFPTAIKEFSYRNGWFYKMSMDAFAAGQSDPLPIHTKLLYDLNMPLPIPI
ncbi:hypothetical protein CTAYLR_002002 [Chrysophaeum taylorii]|uniref:Uncharacterized protein n=1 Tax=Chrysophaeum taylorii TaxID=2483200 RepID=A0AAD7XGB6_9STRA|nr:hypothetical protein CTAYLR_002002 [Chrysophaeum taylorii]